MKHFDEWLTAAYGRLTGNGHKIPLMQMTIDLHKFRKDPKGSCMINYHPDFKDNDELKRMSFEMCDYIRTHYDMEKLIK